MGTCIPTRAVITKISSCQVNTTSRWGIKQLGISFGSIVLLFSYEQSWGRILSNREKSPAPNSLMTALISDRIEVFTITFMVKR